MTATWVDQQKRDYQRRKAAQALCGSCYTREATRPVVLPMSRLELMMCDECSFELNELELLR